MWPGALPRGFLVAPALAITAYGVTLGTIELLAVGFGLVWTVLNFYQYFPITQWAVESAYDAVRGRTERPITMDEADLPRIDLLLPAYEEAAVIAGAIESVRAADYPSERIGLYVVVEPGDDDTRDVLEGIEEDDFTELVVPDTYPGNSNKPRAINYGFEFTEAEIVGVVDAEDLIDPGLFREVALEITSGRDFVQARLDMVNEDDGWLNLLFRAEYGFWYELVLPAFQRVGYPLPLSGTSCFFRRSVLVAANVERRERFDGGIPRDGHLWDGTRRLYGWTPWDPTNVTEDFELGLFLWERGFDVGYLTAETAEESPLSLDAWMRQRTRWKKGKLQTFLKFRQRPPDGLRAKFHLFWQSMLPHLGPVNLAGMILLLVVGNLAKYDPGLIVGSVLSLGLAFVVMSAGLYSVGYWRASDMPTHTRARRVVTVALSLPFYWLLQWVADLRALGQTYTGELGWERIEHHGRNVTGGRRPEPTMEGRTVLPAERRYAALAVIVLVGAALRLVDLGSMSLWLDELYSITVRTQLPLPALLVAPMDPHPPLYYVLLRGWMAMFGETATSARLLSAFLSIATIPALYRLGVEVFDDRVGLIAASLLAISSYHVHFGRTARMYSLFGLATVASWFYLNRLRTGSGVDAAGYLLASAALVYTHAFGLLVLLAQYGYVGLSETRGGIPRRRWWRIQGVLGVVLLPMVAGMALRTARPLLTPGVAAPVNWIPIPSTIAVTQTLLAYLGYPDHYPVLAESTFAWLLAGALLLVALVVVVLAVVTYDPEEGYTLDASWRTGQVAWLFVIPIAVPFAASYVIAPLYAPRYTLPASLGLFLLVGAGVVNVPSLRARRVLLAVFLLGSLVLLGGYFSADSVEDWDEATHALEAGVDPDDVLVLHPAWIDSYFGYYYDGPAINHRSVADIAAGGAASSESAARIWVVTYQQELPASIEDALSERRRVVVYDEGVLAVYRYETMD